MHVFEAYRARQLTDLETAAIHIAASLAGHGGWDTKLELASDAVSLAIAVLEEARRRQVIAGMEPKEDRDDYQN